MAFLPDCCACWRRSVGYFRAVSPRPGASVASRPSTGPVFCLRYFDLGRRRLRIYCERGRQRVCSRPNLPSTLYSNEYVAPGPKFPQRRRNHRLRDPAVSWNHKPDHSHNSLLSAQFCEIFSRDEIVDDFGKYRDYQLRK